MSRDGARQVMTISPPTGGSHVYDALADADIDLLVGLPGTQTLPLDRVVSEREDIRYVMARHETAIPHIAWGYYEAGGVPAATITVPGPGETNAMHGLKNAAQDCVPIVHISADIDPADRGKEPIHEIEAETFDHVVKANLTVERPAQLASQVARGVQLASSVPYGPVRLGIPSGFLARELDPAAVTVEMERTAFDNEGRYADAVGLLRAAKRPVVYAGGGVRRSAGGPAAIQELADVLDAPVMASFKGKGTFPEDDPRYLGVTGSHMPADAREVLATADVVVALGTDFDGVTTADWTLPMGEALIHVNVDNDEVGRAYDPDVAIIADAGEAGAELATRLRNGAAPDGWDGGEVATRCRDSYEAQLRGAGLLKETAPARTPALLTALRDVIPRDAIVTTDIGGFRLWSLQVFPAYGPERYITGGSWAGMGIGLPAAIGAKLARPERPVVALVGDGGLLMNLQECHTAREYDLDLTVIVSNNSDYGVISKSPAIRSREGEANRFAWDSPTFTTIADGFGWESFHAGGVEAAVEHAEASLGNGQPTLIDVDVDPTEPTASEAADYTPSQP